MREKNYISTVQLPCLMTKFKTNKAQNYGFGWSSSNWSGYVITDVNTNDNTNKKKTYHCISGEWIVPSVKPTCRATYSSTWIGIDGFKNSNLIQTGTGHEFVNGKARYYAWWEILPSAETVIPFSVRPGDSMRAIIKKINHNKWSITLRNLSQQWTYRTLQRYIGPQTSAEWVMETPQVDGNIAKLAHVSPTMFTCCRVNGKNPRLTPAMGGTMIQSNATVAIPSCPSSSGNSFVVKPLCSIGALFTPRCPFLRRKS